MRTAQKQPMMMEREKMNSIIAPPYCNASETELLSACTSLERLTLQGCNVDDEWLASRKRQGHHRGDRSALRPGTPISILKR